MPIKIALICSVFLQFAAAIIAITLIKRRRTNIAWWLISFGFLLMAIRRLIELLQVYGSNRIFVDNLLSSWIAVVISMIMLLSLIFVKRIFNIQQRIENLRKQNESMVLSAIIKTEETERQHFAKELHDGLGPLLSSVKMSLSALTGHHGSETNGKILENSEHLIDESIVALKEISNNLSPHMLHNFGLKVAISSFIQKLHLADTPEIRFTSNIEKMRFKYNVEVVIYRILCELISNSLKHASAELIRIDLNKVADELVLEYSDDGIGFDMNSIQSGFRGMGYSNIYSRIKSLNGILHINSEQGVGMKAHISVLIK